jgi:hypothetical protein
MLPARTTFAHFSNESLSGGGEFSRRSNRELNSIRAIPQARAADSHLPKPQNGMNSRGTAARDHQIETKQPRIAPGLFGFADTRAVTD